MPLATVPGMLHLLHVAATSVTGTGHCAHVRSPNEYSVCSTAGAVPCRVGWRRWRVAVAAAVGRALAALTSAVVVAGVAGRTSCCNSAAVQHTVAGVRCAWHGYFSGQRAAAHQRAASRQRGCSFISNTLPLNELHGEAAAGAAERPKRLVHTAAPPAATAAAATSAAATMSSPSAQLGLLGQGIQ